MTFDRFVAAPALALSLLALHRRSEMRKRDIVFVAAALVLMASSVYADTMVTINATTADFEASKAKLLKELDSADYSEITASEKDTVLKALDRIDAHMRTVTRSDQLSEADRTAVFNDQETINTITSHAAADSRMVCEREEKIGTHMPKNICMTVAQRKAVESESQQTMRFEQSKQTQMGTGDH
jgi:hypothetical protein